jgi:hypothetical protein
MISVISCGSAAYKMTNTSFKCLENQILPEIKRIVVIDGSSLLYDKKFKTDQIVVLATTSKFRNRLIACLNEKGFEAVAGESLGIKYIEMIDPFKLEKLETGFEMTYTNREWSDFGNYGSIIKDAKIDAVWVVWARWVKHDSKTDKEEYYKGEPGTFRLSSSTPWLQVSAHLFSAKDGKLLAWTSKRRSGVGIVPFFNWSVAYSSIANGMVKDLAKSLETHQGITGRRISK